MGAEVIRVRGWVIHTVLGVSYHNIWCFAVVYLVLNVSYNIDVLLWLMWCCVYSDSVLHYILYLHGKGHCYILHNIRFLKILAHQEGFIVANSNDAGYCNIAYFYCTQDYAVTYTPFYPHAHLLLSSFHHTYNLSGFYCSVPYLSHQSSLSSHNQSLFSSPPLPDLMLYSALTLYKFKKSVVCFPALSDSSSTFYSSCHCPCFSTIQHN